MATRKKAPLRAVQEGEKPPSGRKKPLTITQAADDGDRLELLVALRARIAKSIEDPNTPARDLAALSKRVLDIAKEIEAIEAAETEDDIGAAAGTPDEEWAAN